MLLPACKASQWIDQTGNNLKKMIAGKAYQQIEIFYGTDRESTGKTNPCNQFTDKRGKLSWGACTVAIPYDKKIGKQESSNFTLTTYGSREAKKYELIDIRPLSLRSFESALSKRLAGNPVKTALVFVHGYNISFEEAALMTARMSYQMKYQGAPLFFSWPAQTGKLDYMADEQNTDFTLQQMKEFLKSVTLKSNAEHIYLVGNSMGCLPLCEALSELQKNFRRRIWKSLKISSSSLQISTAINLLI